MHVFFVFCFGSLTEHGGNPEERETQTPGSARLTPSR